MKFSDLINNYFWPSVELIFAQLYPDQKIYMQEYERVFNDIKIMKPIDSDISIVVSNEIDDFDNEKYVNISGLYSNPTQINDEVTDSLAIEFTSWNKWLGMDIDKKTLIGFSQLEIICHCLHEMTFISFKQDEIGNELKLINRTVNDIKNMTESEKKKVLIPFDEIKKQFKFDNK